MAASYMLTTCVPSAKLRGKFDKDKAYELTNGNVISAGSLRVRCREPHKLPDKDEAHEFLLVNVLTFDCLHVRRFPASVLFGKDQTYERLDDVITVGSCVSVAVLTG